MQQINLSIKSFDFYSIKNTIKILNLFLKLSNFTLMEKKLFLESLPSIGAIKPELPSMMVYKKNFFLLDNKLLNQKILSLPNKLTKFTLIRSPHIDKKSREQFEIKKYKTLMLFNISNVKKTSFFLYMIKNAEFPGVEIQIIIKDTTYFVT